MTAVIDASTLLLLAYDEQGDPRAAAARAVLPHITERWRLEAPSLLAWELLHVLHVKLAGKGTLGRDDAPTVLEDLLTLVHLAPTTQADRVRAATLIGQHGLSGYDAAYLARAIESDCALFLSDDQSLLDVARRELGRERAMSACDALAAERAGLF